MELNDIKDIIKNRRVELGLTQLDIAKAVGVSEATVSRWESGDIGDMKRSRIASLAKVLRMSPTVIMGWKEDDDFQLGSLLSTNDEDLITLINNLANLSKEKYLGLKDIFEDILMMDETQIEQLKKFIIIIKSNILD